MLKTFLPDDVKVNNAIDDIRLRSNLTNNTTLKFTNKSFFYTILCFTQCHSGPLVDFDGFIQLIPGSCKSEKPFKITGVDKVHSKVRLY